MYKKICVFMVLIFLLSNFNVTLVKADNVKKISLEKSFDLMLKNDIDLKLAKLELENLILESKEEKIDNLLINSKTVEKKRKLNIARAENNYFNEINQRLIFIAEKYFKLLELKTEKVIKEKEADYEREVLESIKAEEERGYKNKVDVFSQENRLNNSVIASRNSESDYNHKVKEFKFLLGIDEEKNIGLEGVIDYVINNNLKKIDYKKIINEKKELKFSLYKIEIKENELKKAQETGSAQMTIDKLKNDLEMAKLEKEKMKQNLIDNLKRQHYLYKRAVDNLKMRKNNLSELKDNHLLLKEQYKKGMIKKSDLLNSDLNVLKGKLNYEKAIYNYYLNLFKLKNLFGERLGVDQDV